METTVNQRIGQFFKSKNIQQSEIAIKLGITKQTVSNWVSGTVQIPIKHIIALLTEFEDLNARWLLTGKGMMDDIEQKKARDNPDSNKKEGMMELMSKQLQEKDQTIAFLHKEVGRLEERLENRKK